ncbi:hypothetical protein [Aeromonas veronii]|uniref:hypothetical protein n=1 Tax=Aeromonas veronii TaxID=654 RepID=UPI002485848E|nr:hypothetical protein [Aeromonas veronii]
MTQQTVITAVPVVRDQLGFWTHPAFGTPSDERTDDEVRAWLSSMGMDELRWSFMYEDAPEDVVEAYFARETEGDCSAWDPETPAGKAWVMLSIHDTEDGPVCLWGRPDQKQHEWDDSLERCVKCGDKDWFAGPVCEGKMGE